MSLLELAVGGATDLVPYNRENLNAFQNAQYQATENYSFDHPPVR